MGFSTKKTTTSRGVPIWQGKPVTAAGGFTLDRTGLTDGAILPAGTLIGFDEATRKARPIKALTLQADATNADTQYRVKKGANPAVGEFYGQNTGSKSYDITAVDATSPDYDLITLSTTLGKSATAGTALFQAKAATATTSAPVATPKGLLYEDTDISVNGSLSVVIDGVVYARRIPAIAADMASLIPNVIFSQSY